MACPVTGAKLPFVGADIGGDDLLVGSVVAERYHVAGILGQGSTGTVFGVEHLQSGRRAAMKVLRPRYAPADAVHRVFHGDARAAWSVIHPCLCEVFDVGTLPDGAPFFVMEYLEGETLPKRLLRDRLSLAAAVDVMMQILSAIDAIHQRALLLRELHPQNVFLSHRRGCRPIVKILDFGLARLTPLDKVQEEWDAGPTGSLAHPFYLSPERARSEHGIEPASDLFVAGVIFYEMITGQKPFTATSYNGIMLALAQASPASLADIVDLRGDILPELDVFMQRALSGNPRNRWATARDMQDDLRRVFEGAKRGAPSTAFPMHHPPTSPPSAPTGPHGQQPAMSMGAPSTGRDQTLVRPDATTEHPPHTLMETGELELYTDETETNRKYVDVVAALRAKPDEASADNPHKTLRPPLDHPANSEPPTVTPAFLPNVSSSTSIHTAPA